MSGTGAVTFSLDAGETLAPTDGTFLGTGVTSAIVGLTGDRLLATHGVNVLLSEDAGCTWQKVGTLPFSVATLVGGGPTHAYAWHQNGTSLSRVNRDGSVEALSIPAEFDAIIGLSVRRGSMDVLRLAGPRGEIFESSNGGQSWTRVSFALPTASLIVYAVAFDPNNLDHAIAGTANTGAFVTFDGGRTWTRPTIESPTSERNQNVFVITVSPVNGATVWAQGIDIAEADQRLGSGEHLYLSRDGGRTFHIVLSEIQGTGPGSPPQGGVYMVNGPVMLPHPTDADVLYFVFSLCVNNYGTDVIEYNDATGQHAVRHNEYLSVSALAFAPNRPGTMYVGRDNAFPEICGAASSLGWL